MKRNKESSIKMPAHNKRFHASGGVFPQTVLWEFGSLSPARNFGEPLPALSHRHVVGKSAETVQVDTKK